MIYLSVNRQEYQYEMQNLCRLFFPSEPICIQPQSGEAVSKSVSVEDSGENISVRVKVDEKIQQTQQVVDASSSVKDRERLCGVLLYTLLSTLCGFRPQWGILTGVRPVKLFCACTRQFGSTAEASRFFTENLLVDRSKAELCAFAADADERACAGLPEKSFSLYVSIPFCPTRCDYCSFVSHTVERAGHLIEPYLDLLCTEIAKTAELAKELGLSLQTVYFGGGTPTQLSALQLKRLTDTIAKEFRASDIREYTVEAGRPDTVIREKLQVLLDHGVSRISINPQTLSDSVLKAIGRKHTVQQFFEAFSLARECGFHNINTDLIAGLPTDTAEGFASSLDGILKLHPESVTVHTLCLKRSSALAQSAHDDWKEESELAAKMIKTASAGLCANGYAPYYLYRQSKMLGNLENTGWSLPGFDSLYNIYMMNEVHTVLAVGAGGVSRLVAPGGEQIERIFNYKYPYEYIGRFNELLLRKGKVREFYEKYDSHSAAAGD